jgi:hypothetical protein
MLSCMRIRAVLGAAAAVAVLALPSGALADSTGTVSGLRAQVTRFVTAELHRDTATVCAIVGTPMNATRNGKTCAERWKASIGHYLAQPGAHGKLRADLRAAATAAVSSSGTAATITLPHPLLGGQSQFSWYDNCWMLMR